MQLVKAFCYPHLIFILLAYTEDRLKYFIAHLLTGEARAYHEALTQDLHARFRTVQLHRRIPPHLSLKIPFEADEKSIREIEMILADFCFRQSPVPISYSGFGHFNSRTVYLDVEHNRHALSLAHACAQELAARAPWLPESTRRGTKLHASVARFLGRTQFRRVWGYVHKRKPRFRSSLDNIAILKKTKERWEIHSLLQFGTGQQCNILSRVPSYTDIGEDIINIHT